MHLVKSLNNHRVCNRRKHHQAVSHLCMSPGGRARCCARSPRLTSRARLSSSFPPAFPCIINTRKQWNLKTILGSTLCLNLTFQCVCSHSQKHTVGPCGGGGCLLMCVCVGRGLVLITDPMRPLLISGETLMTAVTY